MVKLQERSGRTLKYAKDKELMPANWKKLVLNVQSWNFLPIKWWRFLKELHLFYHIAVVRDVLHTRTDQLFVVTKSKYIIIMGIQLHLTKNVHVNLIVRIKFPIFYTNRTHGRSEAHRNCRYSTSLVDELAAACLHAQKKISKNKNFNELKNINRSPCFPEVGETSATGNTCPNSAT